MVLLVREWWEVQAEEMVMERAGRPLFKPEFWIRRPEGKDLALPAWGCPRVIDSLAASKTVAHHAPRAKAVSQVLPRGTPGA